MDSIDIRFVGDLATVSLKPGDALVVTCEGDISCYAAERVKAYIEDLFPGHECVVLGGGLKLQVMEKAA